MCICALYFISTLCVYTKVYFRSIFHLYSVCIYQGLFPIYISSLLCVYIPRFICALYFISTLCVATKFYFRSIIHLYSVRIYQGLFPLYISSLLCVYVPWNRKNQSPKSNDQRKLKFEQIRLLAKKRRWNTYYNCYEFCWC